jgi:hypothetical protein
VPWDQLWTNVFWTEVRFVLSDQASADAHIDNFVLAPAPEPSSLALLSSGLSGLAWAARRRGGRVGVTHAHL